ncbi:MAG: BNR-4 repeat-containing protein [Kiritimatiellia bacterium]
MKKLLILCSWFLIAVPLSAGERVVLWPEGKIPDLQSHQIAATTQEMNAPGFKAAENIMPHLDWYEAPADKNGRCMLLISGGAYNNCCDGIWIDRVAEKFTGAGYDELTKHAVNATYGSRRSFGHGVYNPSADKTVICWNGERMSIYVREFDHKTRQWSESVQAYPLNFIGIWDYHNYPCIVRAPDGHYLIFYFFHSWCAYLVRSPGPDRIDGTWSHSLLSNDRCAYPMPVVVDDTIYLFYSSTAAFWYRPYRMIKSTDNGKTWSEPVTLIDSGHKQEEKYDEVYLHGFSVDYGGKDEPARILLGWEMASGPKGHNEGGYGNFVACFNCENGKMYNAAGRDLGSVVDLEEMYNDCIISDARSADSRLFGYTTFPEFLPDGSIAVLYSLKGRNCIVNWRHSSWELTELPITGGIDDYQRTDNGSYVILSGGNKAVTVWESDNGVNDWREKSVTKLPSENGSDAAVKGFIDGFRSEVQWMAVTYDIDQRKKDYSGKWPVFTYGVVLEKTDGSSQESDCD